MIKAIFYKEWIKMRCFYPLSALFLFGATAYAAAARPTGDNLQGCGARLGR